MTYIKTLRQTAVYLKIRAD